MICPICGEVAVLMDSARVYGVSYGPMWACINYPACDTFVTCHPGTTRPKGTLADWDTRQARKRAHAVFDPIWRSGRLTRTGAYRWLARQLGMREGYCHIGEMNVAQCRRVVEVAGRLQIGVTHDVHLEGQLP